MNGKPVPQRAFPLRRVDQATLERFVRLALSADVPEPFTTREVRCQTVSTCQATFIDPLYPRMPYRVRYRFGGEQLPGCWLVRDWLVLDPLPYEDTYRGVPPAGCASWLR